ncbi:hypothetical protein Dda_9275 [Drechslerella dactyloides]|uniref:Uncharacterized protein n=1 Tax=Drechslerella dactyloides TaxID=74499 RepID=A0AAD6NFC5_DREDA|nr:hypothetical protein Dda_9275 [Drechslerella dactyloides]
MVVNARLASWAVAAEETPAKPTMRTLEEAIFFEQRTSAGFKGFGRRQKEEQKQGKGGSDTD